MSEYEKKCLHIALAFDQHFITPFYVLVTSIFINNKDLNIVIHCIATGLNECEIDEVKAYVTSNNAEIYFYHIDEDLVEHFVIPENTHFTVATYYRLFFPALVPEYITNLLYLDVDIVVINSLSSLYSINLDKYPVAAVVDNSIPKRDDLGIHDVGNYFNAGVLLINLSEWRKQQISESAIDFLLKYPEKIKVVDQDALNAILINNWFKLENRYNLMLVDVPADLPEKDFNRYLDDKTIIHYTTKYKPWLTICRNRLRFLYHYYKRLSPKSHERKYTDFNYTYNNFVDLLTVKLIDIYVNNAFLVKLWRKLKN